MTAGGAEVRIVIAPDDVAARVALDGEIALRECLAVAAVLEDEGHASGFVFLSEFARTGPVP